MNPVDMIKALSSAFGAPGFEDDVVKLAKDLVPGTETFEDSTRNLYIYSRQLNPDLPTVMVDAHSDEVGFMVQAIKKNGTIAFITLGTWLSQVVMAQKVLIRNIHGKLIPGIISSTPPHFSGGFKGEKEQLTHISEMSIDVGASSKEEAMEKFGIAIGSPIVPYSTFVHDEANDIIMSKAFDCRLGCASVLHIMNEIGGIPLNVNVVGVLTSQEENGIRGARVAANRVKPDLAICFEGTPADDTFMSEDLAQTVLKKGPMLRHIDQAMVTHPRFLRLALDVGKKQGIPVQEAVRTGGGTNGSAIHLSNLGVPTIVIGHPTRYVHSPNSIASLNDWVNGTELAIEILKELNKEIINDF
ncbi:MAG: M20/M25/M40 family metallo-hydrolase [Defluviitaleaceae bacterium]|nr:M20/M25/M40 family metallo-hydrolase [Defluviitaleaceae bacterium]